MGREVGKRARVMDLGLNPNVCPIPTGRLSYLGFGSRHQQHDARTVVAGERRHGFLSVLDILPVNLKMTHNELTRRRECRDKRARL